MRTVDASRLMGASVIITGLWPEIAQTLATIGVDLSKMNNIVICKVVWRRPNGCSATLSAGARRQADRWTQDRPGLDPATG